jgi:hypothetical protein
MKTTANNETRAAMNAAYLNPFVTTLTLDEVPHKRKYTKELRAGDFVAVFVSTSQKVWEGYFSWKEIRTIAATPQAYVLKFTDGTDERHPKFSAGKWEVMK